MNKKKIALLIIAAVALWFLLDFSSELTLENAKNQQILLNEYISENLFFSISSYFLLYIIVAALSIPGATILTLLAAALFGFWTSLLIVSFASTMGASLAFLFSRYLLRDWVQNRFSSHLQSINNGIKKDGEFYLLTLRLIPVIPFFIINLLMGLTKMRLVKFYLFSQIGMLPATAIYLNAGTQLAELQTISDLLSTPILISLIILGLFPLITKTIINNIQSKKVYEKWSKPKSFDQNMVVIGAGSGGLVSSYIAAAVKAKVTLIEKSSMGGDCLNTGCVPSKALIRVSHNINEIKSANKFGIDAQINEIDFKKVMQRVKDVIKQVEPHDSIDRYTELGVTCLQGEAKIISPWLVEIDNKVISTQNIVIATGAKPFVPPIEGIDLINFVTSDDIWSIKTLPKKMLILGGGPVGCELAQCFNNLGSDVTILEKSNQLLMREDQDAAEILSKQLIDDGVNILFNHNVKKFNHIDKKDFVELESDGKIFSLEFDLILIAIGRQANVTGFGLEALGVELSLRKSIEVNEYMQTKYPNIYAVGDVTGPYQLTHAAAHQAWHVSVNALFGKFKKFKIDYRVLPAAVYTYPELARVGINEKEAMLQSIAYEVTKYEIKELDRAIADLNDFGFVKVITSKGSDKILGVTIVGAHGGDLLAEFTLAMKYNLGLNKILSTIHPYPTMSEALKYTAGVWKKNHSPKTVLNWVEKYHNWTRK